MTAKNIVIEGSRIQIKDVISVAIHEEQIILSSSGDFIISLSVLITDIMFFQFPSIAFDQSFL